MAGGFTVPILVTIAVYHNIRDNPHLGHYYLEIEFLANVLLISLLFALGGAIAGAAIWSFLKLPWR
jgi:hypothetical protein